MTHYVSESIRYDKNSIPRHEKSLFKAEENSTYKVLLAFSQPFNKTNWSNGLQTEHWIHKKKFK